MLRPFHLLTCVLLVLCIAVSGCTSAVLKEQEGDGGEAGEQGGIGGDGSGGAAPGDLAELKEKAIDVRPTNSWNMPGGEAEVSLHRVDDEHMVAVLKITNTGGGKLNPFAELADNFGQLGGTDHDYPWTHFSGIGWLDPQGRTLHKPFHNTDRTCLCTETDDTFINQEGDEWEGYAVLAAPPADVSALTVITHVALPFVDVPVQQGPPDIDYAEPSSAPEAEPEQAALESVIDAEDEVTFEDSESTDINLATDVLFDVDKSDLTAEADALIGGAAEQVEALGATKVEIAGHTDNTGDDSINSPLSEDRADAVQAALEERLDGVGFTTVGHGSSEPIASNGDDEGRRLNRRVTISVPADGLPAPGSRESGSEQEGGRSEGDGEGTPAEEAAITGPAGDAFDDSVEVDLQLTGLRAVSSTTALLSYEVTNPSDSEDVTVSLDMSSDRWQEFRYHATHSVTLTDASGERVSHPLRVESLDGDDTAPFCLCSSTSGINLGSTMLDPGESAEYYAILPVRAESATADVTVGEIGTLEDIAVESP